MLKEHEADASLPDLAGRYGVAENTIYRAVSGERRASTAT